jgi:hypothetical protein
MSSTFDVHNYIKNSKRYGVKEDLAEFQAREIQKAIEDAVASIVSKELAKKSDLADTEVRLIKWLLFVGISSVTALTGVIIGAIKYIPH